MSEASIERLANELLDEHGLTDKGWTFEWAERIVYDGLGWCDWRTKRIILSCPLAPYGSKREIRDTILHEIAHALAGPDVGHGPKWKKIALAVGASPKRMAPQEATPHYPDGYYRWVGVCPGCNEVYRRQTVRGRLVCSACCAKHNGGVPTKEYLINWRNTRTGQARSG